MTKDWKRRTFSLQETLLSPLVPRGGASPIENFFSEGFTWDGSK